MALGDPDDVLRSLRRYVAQMLGSPPWSVRIQRTRVADDQRPVAVVEESAPLLTPFARAATITQGDVQKSQAYSIVCYPVLEADASESRQEAGRVRSLLDAGFSRGLVTDDTPPKNIGAPFAFPIYDFAGVPVVGPAAARKGPDTPYQHALIDRAFNVRAIQDPEDELRFTVVATVTASWWQPGRVRPPAPIAARLPGAPAVQ
jgi:hypothetical protein